MRMVLAIAAVALASCGGDGDNPTRMDCDRAIVTAVDNGSTYADGWRLPDGCDGVYAETPNAVPEQLRPAP